MRSALPTLLAALALLAAVPGAHAATPRTTLPDVEDEVMCTVCGTPLNQAQAPQADRQRALIRQLIARGATKEEIKRRLVDEYGPEVLATPPREGFNLAAHAVPVALGLAALAALALVAARWRRRRPAALAAPSPLSRADARRLDEDLARYDG
jgi:cytochrome c-type biogenesis protein CcmH/NrfF